MLTIAIRLGRRTARGVTLFEVLIVVAIMALIASGVGVAVFKYWIEAQQKTAETSARTLRGAVKAWWVTHDPGTCPRVEQLFTDGALDADSPRRDPWGTEWRIECAGDEVTVISGGRDRKLGTEDDIRVPPT
jgi:general secretion pathway protein G